MPPGRPVRVPSGDPYRRYLRLLGIESLAPGLAGLRQIVASHIRRVPFENVSKLLLYGREGAGRPATLSEFLDGIEHFDLGGTCYSSNPFLAGLLRAVGYDADLLGADMSAPNVHTCIRVRLDGAAYHADVGYAAPFREPLRLDRLPHQVSHGSHRYVLDRDPQGALFEVNEYSGQERLHGYRAHEPPRDSAFFHRIVLDSYLPGKTFMSCLRITRFFEDYTVELRDRTLAYYAAGASREAALSDRAALESAVANHLAMPRCPITQAVEDLERITGKPLFGPSLPS